MPSSNKKRKVDKGGPLNVPSASAVKVESDAGPPPPDNSKFSPVQKILHVDFMSDDSDVVESAMMQLADMCYSNDENSEATAATLTRFGAGSHIVAVMNKWHAAPTIQAEACCALTNMSEQYHDFGDSAKEIGCLDAVVWAMTSYPENELVQANGCGALGNLVHNQKSNADYIVNELNVIPLIVASMKNHAQIVSVQCFACHALRILSCWDGFGDAIKQDDGDRALFDAIKNHQDESNECVKDIQEDGREALKNLL